MTPKQRVLKKYPDAYAQRSTFGTGVWFIWRDAHDAWLGSDYGPKLAWADAAKRLRRRLENDRSQVENTVKTITRRK